LDCGNLVDNITGIDIPPNSEVILEIPWCAPDPSDFNCLDDSYGGADDQLGHFCFLAHFDDDDQDDLAAGGALATDVGYNSWQKNNVAWKNVEIIDDDISEFTFTGATLVANISNDKFIRLDFDAREDNNLQTVLDYNRVRLYLSKQLVKSWKEGGAKGEGIVPVNDSVIEIVREHAYMANIFMQPDESAIMAVGLKPVKPIYGGSTDYFKFDVAQFDSRSNSVPVGGERFLIQKEWTIRNCYDTYEGVGEVISGNTPFLNDTIFVGTDINLNRNDTLTFSKCVVFMGENVKINLSENAQLNIFDSEITNACLGEKWKGIHLLGDTAYTDQLNITGSFINGTDTVFRVFEANEVNITGSSFLGSGSGLALYVTKTFDFDFSNNTVFDYQVGVKTVNNRRAKKASLIQRNNISEVDTAMSFSGDYHNLLWIACNTLRYALRGISSSALNLKDQGSTSIGAGNEFISTSTATNHMLAHTNSAMRYYYDPSMSVASYMNVTEYAATNDEDCFTYSFDTTSSHRYIPFAQVNSSPAPAIISIVPVPNPSNGNTDIHYNCGEGLLGSLIINDMFGKKLEQFELKSDKGIVNLQYANVAKGLYIITLINSQGEYRTSKLIIQ
jgi:hypothetical protein